MTDRPGDLFLGDRHVVGDTDEDGGLDVVARLEARRLTLAADEYLGFYALADVALDAFVVPGGHHGLDRVAHCAGLRLPGRPTVLDRMPGPAASPLATWAVCGV
jgi:hypothetical protein